MNIGRIAVGFIQIHGFFNLFNQIGGIPVVIKYLSYLVRCVWYMMLTGIDRTDLAVLFGNTDFRIYEISRELELEQKVLERAVCFWENYVMTDTPPAATSESDYKTLFGKSTVSKSVEAPAETCELIKKLKSLNEQDVSSIKQSIMG